MPHTTNVSMRLAIALLAMLLAAMLLAVPGSAFAQRVEGDPAAAQGLYEAEVPVRSQTEAERSAGFARGLAQVLARLSGSRAIARKPGVSEELRRASDYVAGYDYRQDEGVSASTGAPSFTTTLVVRFDEAKVDDIAAALGLPVWPQPRPKPVLWLAIDDGSGPRLVDVGKAKAARSALDQAQARGYRLGLPSGTAAEQAMVGAIWRGDIAAIANISSRYTPPMQLVGKLYRGGDGWRADWTFIDHGKAISNWTSQDRSALRAMASGADGAADALVARYAKAQPIGPPGRYRVVFTGLDGSLDYMQLVAWLRGQSVVRDMKPVNATAGRLEFELELATGLAGLRRVLDDNLLVEVGASDPPTFQLR
ncbi:MAG: DUF2066 domain-containing protein [Luteimonas sp.]